MKKPRFSNAIGNLDDDLIEAAAECKRKKKPNLWLKWGSIAACFAFVVVAAVIVVPMLQGGDPGIELGDHQRPWKDVTISAGESAYVWPWEYKTIDEKYLLLNIEGKEFSGRQKEIGATLIGEKIGTYKATGYDDYSEGVHHENFDIYEIKGISSEELVAANMDGKYYVFISEEWNPPATFGEVLDLYNLQSTMELKHFSVEEHGKEDRHYNLSNDEYIWELLSSCRSAEYADPKDWVAHDRDYISFTITSEALGVYKHAMYITEDGYFWTNAFNGAYLYRIGTDAAKAIIDYAVDNAVPGEFVPYMHRLAGTITEIGDGYILLDDSILCVNPDDGITYKIVTTNPKISRLFDSEMLSVGDTVQVQYTDFVDLEPNAVIDSAAGIYKAKITGGDVLIPE